MIRLTVVSGFRPSCGAFESGWPQPAGLRHPTEVFHDICPIHLRPGDPCRLQGVLQNSADLAEERMTGKIFLVARLLAYQHN